MAITVANTANTNVFSYWLARTNELAYSMSTYAITVGASGANANYTVPTGNAQIYGTFTANAITVGNSTVNVSIIGSTSTITANAFNINTLLVGNSTTNATLSSTSLSVSNSTANITITIPTAVQIANGQYYLNANGSYAYASTPYSPITNSQITTSGVSLQVVDSYLMSTYNAAEYLVSVKDNTANNFYTSKIITTHDGNVGYLTEYGVFVTNTSIGTFSASSNATSVILGFTPTSSSTRIKFTRIIA